jgi:hypothetical protein
VLIEHIPIHVDTLEGITREKCVRIEMNPFLPYNVGTHVLWAKAEHPSHFNPFIHSPG